MSKKTSWINAIKEVLETTKKPLHYTEITDLIVERELREKLGATPANSVSVSLHKDIKDKKGKSSFVKVQRGTFVLRKYLNQIEEEEELVTNEKGLISKNSNVIRSFGISWKRDNVYWKIEPDFYGLRTKGATIINFKDQRGIYLLYDGREVVYVGQVRWCRKAGQ